MATHAHAPNEHPASPGDNAAQTLSGVPNGGKPYITGLNFAEARIVEHAESHPRPGVKDLRHALSTLAIAHEADQHHSPELAADHARRHEVLRQKHIRLYG